MKTKTLNFFYNFSLFLCAVPLVITLKSVILSFFIYICDILNINKFKVPAFKHFLEYFYNNISVENWEEVYLALFHRLPFELLVFKAFFFIFCCIILIKFGKRSWKFEDENLMTFPIAITCIFLTLEPLTLYFKTFIFVPELLQDHILFLLNAILSFLVYLCYYICLFCICKDKNLFSFFKVLIILMVTFVVYYLTYDLWIFFQKYSMIFTFRGEDAIEKAILQLNYILSSVALVNFCMNEQQTPSVAEVKGPCADIREYRDYYCDMSKQISKIKTVKGGNTRVRNVINGGILSSKVASAKICEGFREELDKCLKDFTNAAAKKK